MSKFLSCQDDYKDPLCQTDSADPVDADVKIFTNPMGEWHASTENSDYDVISHPSHYTEGRKYEPKDVIRDWGLNFNLGCVVKYISRAGRKDDILQDLEKARQYLDFEIEAIKAERGEKTNA